MFKENCILTEQSKAILNISILALVMFWLHFLFLEPLFTILHCTATKRKPRALGTCHIVRPNAYLHIRHTSLLDDPVDT